MTSHRKKRATVGHNGTRQFLKRPPDKRSDASRNTRRANCLRQCQEPQRRFVVAEQRQNCANHQKRCGCYQHFTRAKLIHQGASAHVCHQSHQRSRQQHHTRVKRRTTAQFFHVQRNNQHDTHKCRAQNTAANETPAILAVGEDIHADQRIGHALFATHEQNNQQGTHDYGKPYRNMGHTQIACVAETQKQAHEAETANDKRWRIEAFLFVAALRARIFHGGNHHNHHAGEDKPEKALPSERALKRTADSGAKIYHETHGNTVDSHKQAHSFVRHINHNHGLHSRHHQSRAGRLHNARQQRHGKQRRCNNKKRARGNTTKCHHHHKALGEAFRQKRSKRNENTQRQNVARGEPLACGNRNAHFGGHARKQCVYCCLRAITQAAGNREHCKRYKQARWNLRSFFCGMILRLCHFLPPRCYRAPCRCLCRSCPAFLPHVN